jgi:hypothetical protein
LKAITAAKILYGALDEMVTNWILSKRNYPLAPMADEVLKVFFGGVTEKMNQESKVESQELIRNLESTIQSQKSAARIPLYADEPKTLAELFLKAAENTIAPML